VPLEADDAAAVEARVLDALAAFLHPLTGGPDGKGWGFGQAASLSQIARLIEETLGVDVATRVALATRGEILDEWVPVGPDEMIASGTHELKLMLAAEAC
jgi:hypothetical protein